MARGAAARDAHRFVLLDALRGVAAIAVMLFHFGHGHPGLLTFKHGYLAVDFFFALSGFVIAHAYENRLRTTMTMRRFLAARAVRLLPMVVLAVAGTLGLRILLLHGRCPPELAASAALGALLLPSLWLEERYPLVPPSWSLAYEMAVNLLYAAVVRHLGTRVLIAVVALAGLLHVATIARAGAVDLLYHNLAWGLARTIVSFGLGVLIFRWHRRAARRIGGAHAVWLTAALIALLIAPPLGRYNAAFEIVATTLLMPLIVALASTVRLGDGAAGIGDLLGRLSYPVYVLHFSGLFAVFVLFGKIGRPPPAGLPQAVVLIGSWLALRCYDEPLRAKLGAWLHARRREPAESAP